uniref:Rab effector MyRIP/Melanophilin domain-containing protein n=1 Tax=Mola mola TaxID=94237 RepID=A0A3Q3W724_MOLML
MFDLKVEPAERPKESSENFLQSRKKDVQNDETGVVEKKEDIENDGKAKVLSEAEEMGAEVLIASHETKVQLEKLPEAKWTAGEEGEVRQAEIRESKERQEGWETAADSEDEDEEFDKVISSMLMMTLEDMQGGALDEGAAESGKINGEQVDNVKTEIDKCAPEETGSTKDFQSQGENGRKESAVGETTAENEAQQDGEDRKDKETDAKEHLVTGEAQQTGEEVQVDKREDRGGKVTTEGRLTETRGDAAEGGCDRKETETRIEETKEEKAESVEQSGTSPHEGPLSPGEIQIVSISRVQPVVSQLQHIFQPFYRATSDMELSFLEEQVASASAKVQQSELQISDISSRIAALRSAGLNVNLKLFLTSCSKLFQLFKSHHFLSCLVRIFLCSPKVSNKNSNIFSRKIMPFLKNKCTI